MKAKFTTTALCMIFIAVSAFSADTFWAQATFVKGDVKVKPSGGNASSELRLGAVLRKGDTVITADKSRASFLMSDGSIKVVMENSALVLAPSAEPEAASLKTVAENLSKSLLSREGDNPMLKHLGGLRGGQENMALAPDKTKVHAGKIKLCWLPAPGVSKYTVTLMGPGDSMFETTVEKTFFSVPDEKILPGTTYYWEVRNAAERDSITSLGSGSFSTLDKKEDSTVRDLEKSISSAIKPGDAQDPSVMFILYQVYREHGMNLDALSTLEKINSAEAGNTEVLRLRKELLRELGMDEKSIGVVTSASAGE